MAMPARALLALSCVCHLASVGAPAASTAVASTAVAAAAALPPRSFHAVIVRAICAAPAAASHRALTTSSLSAQVSTSRYWFNYRHTTNALTIYHRLRRSGVPDDNIGAPLYAHPRCPSLCLRSSF